MRKRRTLTGLRRPRLAETGATRAPPRRRKAKEAKGGGAAKTTQGQRSKSVQVRQGDKKSDSPVPARRTTRASAKAAAGKIVAKEDGEEEDVVPESQEPLSTARPEDLTYDAFVAATLKRGTAHQSCRGAPGVVVARGDDKTTSFSNKFDSGPLRKMTRRGKTLPPRQSKLPPTRSSPPSPAPRGTRKPGASRRT